MALEIDHLYKTFGKTKALNGMNFTVNPGELYGFVGSNGAGKTTTMRIILGVLNADSGAVRLDGKSLDFDARKWFGYMPEERGLYPKMKVGDQLVYLARLQGLSSSDAKSAMEYWTERLGVAARRKDEVQALSLGNQQRVQLAAALVHNPSVLILDEPFSGLDPVAVEAMSSVLTDKVAEGSTVVFSSHQLDLVERLCDRIGICAQGKMVAEGGIDTLRTTEGISYDVVGPDPRQLQHELQPLGVQVEPTREGARVALPQGVSDQDILRAALAAGPVRAFTPHRPHLAEIFKDVVTVPDEKTEEESKPKKKGLRALFGRK